MSNKKKTNKAPARLTGRVIDFNSLLGNWPTIQIGDQQIEGRHVNQVEKLAWLEAEVSEDLAAQQTWLVGALNARGANVDIEWVQQWPDTFLVALAKGLYGNGWPGEEGVEGK